MFRDFNSVLPRVCHDTLLEGIDLPDLVKRTQDHQNVLYGLSRLVEPLSYLFNLPCVLLCLEQVDDKALKLLFWHGNTTVGFLTVTCQIDVAWRLDECLDVLDPCNVSHLELIISLQSNSYLLLTQTLNVSQVPGPQILRVHRNLTDNPMLELPCDFVLPLLL